MMSWLEPWYGVQCADQNSSVLIADWLRAWSKLVVKIGYRESLLYT